MRIKKIHPAYLTIITSALTSTLVSAVCFYLLSPKVASQVVYERSNAQAAPISDPKFGVYQKIITSFLTMIQKGKLEEAYASTSPIFKKKTDFAQFKALIDTYTAAKSIPPSECLVVEYSESFSSKIDGLTDTYRIVQTKCEAQVDGELQGFSIEFIDDSGTPKISYISSYKTPITHKK